MEIPVLIITKIGSIHDDSFGNAMRLIGAIAECGVDAVEFHAHFIEIEGETLELI